MKDRQPLAWLIATSLLLSGCSEEQPPVKYSSYDECILSTVGKAPNAEAVTQLQASCIRKFETTSDLKLDVKEAAESGALITIANDIDAIVTEVELDAGEFGKWGMQDWIEPGDWVDIEAPENAMAIRNAAEAGEVQARAVRIIPVVKSK